MKPATLLLSAGLLSIAAAGATSLLLGPGVEGATGREEPSADPRLAELARGQDALREELAELRRLVESRPSAAAGTRVPVLDEAELERAVARVLERRAEAAASSAADAGRDELALAALLRDLFDPGLGDAEEARIWERLRSEGLVDEALAEFERRASAAPFDSRAQTELGWAYFQKMLGVGGGPEAGRWGSRGADALARALELDERNWDARFSLAQHLYYADMRGDSIRHLEVLLQQQADRVPEEKHARAYLLLGNLLMDMGRSEEAERVWTEGLRIFPDDAALRARLDAFR